MSVPAPPHVAPYVEALGPEGAERCFLTFGGSEVWIEGSSGQSKLAVAFGTDAVRVLGDRLGAAKVRVPTAKAWLAHTMRARGLPVAEIARSLHTTDVTVRKYLSQPVDGGPGGGPRDPRQMTFL